MKQIRESLIKKSFKHYAYLINNNFSENQSLKLVGDRFSLTGIERSILKMGVRKKNISRKIYLKKLKSIILLKLNFFKSSELYIDGWNVIITIDSYLKGKPVVISSDSFVRDVSHIGNNYSINNTSYEIILKILKLKSLYGFKKLKFLFEEKVGMSKNFIKNLKDMFKKNKNISFELTFNNDPILINHKIVASSDSIVLEKSMFIFDIPHIFLKKHYNYKPLKLFNLFYFY